MTAQDITMDATKEEEKFEWSVKIKDSWKICVKKPTIDATANPCDNFIANTPFASTWTSSFFGKVD